MSEAEANASQSHGLDSGDAEEVSNVRTQKGYGLNNGELAETQEEGNDLDSALEDAEPGEVSEHDNEAEAMPEDINSNREFSNDDSMEAPESVLQAQGFGFNDQQLKGALEALLFVTDEPVNVLTLADVLQIDPAKVEEILVALQEELLSANRGIQLREVAGGWRLVTHPIYHELIESYVASWDTRKLSQAALETLAIIAYCQPVTRNEISSIRGVSSDSSVNSLMEKGLLREAGVQDAPGNPVLYATSKAFLEKFGLKNTSELPPLESFAPDEETKALIAERLRVVKISTEGAEGATGAGEIEGARGTEGAVGAEGVVGTEGAERIEGTGGTPSPDKAGEGASQSALEFGQSESAEHSDAVQQAMRSVMADALASSAGVVDKIDFDNLVFEED